LGTIIKEVNKIIQLKRVKIEKGRLKCWNLFNNSIEKN